MAQSAKKLTYTIRAEYEGKGNIKQLSDDLKKLNQVEVLQGVEESFKKTTKDFVDAKAKVRNLAKAMREPGGEAFAASYKKATQEVKKLQSSLQKQKQKMDDTRTSLKQQGVEVSKITGQYADMQAAAERQARAIAARQQLGVRSWRAIETEIDGLKRAYKDMEASGEHSMAELAAAKDKLRVKVQKLNAEMGKSEAVHRRSVTNFRNMEGPLGRMTSNLTAFVTGFVGLAGLLGAGYGISRMVTDVTENARQLEVFSRVAGMSVNDFSAAAYAVKDLGIEQDKLADISKDVKDKIGDFVETGGGEFKDFMENIGTQAGIAAEELIKLSGPDALIAVKKAMDDVGVAADNQVTYLEAIANDASLLIPLLENEGKAFKELAQYAKESGIALSDIDHAELMELHEALKDFRENIGIVRREIVLALIPSLQQLAEYFKENKDEIKDFAVEVGEGVGKLIQFVVENREVITDLGKLSIALLAANVGFTTLRGAMDLASVGSKLIPWLGSLITSLKAVNIAALGAASGLGAAAGGALAFLGGYSIGGKIDEWEYFNSVVGANKDALAEVPEKFRRISEATGVTIKSFKELNQAEKDGLIHFDQATGEWKKGAGEMADSIDGVGDAAEDSFDRAAGSAKDSADKQRGVFGEALEAMKQQYQEYVEEIGRLQDQIAGREQDLAAQLRSMSRSAMSDLGAWRDRKKEADEYYQAAGRAARAGDFDQAVDLADKAKAAYADLNKEVKSGDAVLISQQKALETASGGVKKAGELAIDILKKQEDAARDAADELNQKAGGKLGTEHLEKMKDYTVNYGKEVQKTTKHWETQWETVEKDGTRVLKTIAGDIDALSGKTIDVYVKYIEKKNSGGLVGPTRVTAMATGGMYRSALAGYHFRGYGGGDRPKNLVMAEDGEVMIRKEMVRASGLRAALAWNAGRFDIVMRELLQRFDTGVLKRSVGGPISMSLPPMPSLSPQYMSEGGVVAAGGSGGGHYTMDFSGLPDQKRPIRGTFDNQSFEEMVRIAERRKRLGGK